MCMHNMAARFAVIVDHEFGITDRVDAKDSA